MSAAPTTATLHLPREHADALSAWAREGYPHEACGLLLGRSAEGRTEVVEVTRARNLNAERARDRYDLDPADQLAAEERARALGCEVVGVWHTHPDHPARPSETDRAAAWEGYSYVIVSVGPDAVDDLRSWRLRGADFHEETLSP